MKKKTEPPVSVDKDFVTHVLNGKVYHLCCTWKALKIASVKLKSLGISTNLLVAIDFRHLGPEMVAPLFFAMAVQQHPDLTYAEIDDAIDLTTWEGAFVAMAEAYQQAMAPLEKGGAEDPQQVGQS